MRIAEVEAFALRAPFTTGPYWGARSWGDSNVRVEAASAPAFAHWEPAYEQELATTVVRVRTDTNHIGWGEAKAPVAPEVCRDFVHSLLRPVLTGKDPRDLAPLWDAMYGRMALRNHRGGFLLEAISAIDIALWDVVGRASGVPIATLLGGAYRERIPLYASGVVGLLGADDQEERVAQEARELATAGFRAVKIAIGQGLELDRRSLEVARAAVPELPLLADAAGRYDLAQARELLTAVEKADLLLLEAPLPAELSSSYEHLARETRIPLACDLLGPRWDWLDLLKRSGVGVIQPDVSRAGGLTESRRIAWLADAFGVECMPHMSLSSVIHQAASVHFAAALPRLRLMEFWTGSSALSNGSVATELEIEDGSVVVPSGSGLGIEIDEAALLSYVC
jgi:L-alanine-DL-glutamate epimerase-like enolase superfamily enzyme